MTRPFDERVALITGASRGIGRATALAFASQGARVVVNYQVRADAAQQVADEIRSGGGQAEVLQADVAQAEQVSRLVAATLEAFGRIDVLVNNAGITRDTLLLRMSDADWGQVIATNLTGPFLTTRAVLRPMLRQHYGRIVNITSIAGILGNPGQANYAASKAGLIGLTRSTAREVAERHITCNALAVGLVPTEIWEGVPQPAVDALRQMIPVKRTGTPDEVAQAVLFLAAEASGYITGQVLNVDGGLVMA